MPSNDCQVMVDKKSGDSVGPQTRRNAPSVHSVAGTSAAIAAAALLQPLDVIKTFQQQQRSLRSLQSSSEASYNSIQATRAVIRSNGFFGLWRGLVPTVLRVAPGSAVYFFLLSKFRNNYRSLKKMFGDALPTNRAINDGERDATIPLWYNISSSALSRTIACVILIPLTVMKTRMESSWSVGNTNINGSLLEAAHQMRTKEGFRVFFSGLLPTIIRDVPFSSIYFGCYELLKANFLRNDACVNKDTHPIISRNLAGNLVCGISAGFLASFITHPADVLRTRMQLQGTLSHAHEYCKNASSAGATPTGEATSRPNLSGNYDECVLIVVGQSIYSYQHDDFVVVLAFYMTIAAVMMCAVCLYLGFSFAAANGDKTGTITSTRQAQSNFKFNGMIRNMYTNEGAGVFFHGLGPRVLKRTLMSALTWAAIDEILFAYNRRPSDDS